MLVVGLSLAFLIGVVAIAASAANVQDLLYNRLGKLDVALALPVIGATTLLWSANLTATALFAVSWNWLLQGDINSGRIGLRRAMSDPAKDPCACQLIACPRPLPCTLQQPVPVHSKQRCWCSQ